ncbi:MAG: hypothetical protein LBF26_01065 [Puniceicoccales bacterium]|jgi:hypothetical protein|nr:hypothetical protein [Puniceicoccales bacterium]
MSVIRPVQDHLAGFAAQQERLGNLIERLGLDAPAVLVDRYIAAMDLENNTRALLASLQSIDGYSLPSVANVVMAFALWVAADSPGTRKEMWDRMTSALNIVKDEAGRMGKAMIDLNVAAAEVERARAGCLDAKSKLVAARRSEVEASADATARRAQYDTMSWFGRVFVGVKD